MPIYEINCKGYYYEHSQYYVEHIESSEEKEALRKFFLPRVIGQDIPVTVEEAESLEWEEGDWFMRFHSIHRVTKRPCPHCSGTGSIWIGERESEETGEEVESI